MDTSSLMTLQAAQTQAQASAQASATSALAGTSGTSADKAKNAKLGLDFESMCLSNLISPMFEGLKTDGPFGGGQGEEAMRSFYIDAIAKGMAKRGGIGISDMMQKQLLKLQEAKQETAEAAQSAAPVATKVTTKVTTPYATKDTTQTAGVA